MQKLTFFNYKIQNNASVCDIYIDGIIVDASKEEFVKKWWDDSTPTSFKSVRTQIGKDAKTVNVYINSGGGQVVEAWAIHDYLKNLQANGVTVNCFGRGLIASAATYILMASSNSTISENSSFMVHNVSGGTFGNVNEVENYAVMMRKFNDQITNYYSTVTGLSNTIIKNMMNNETWLSGKEAVELKFVKNLENQQTFSNTINANDWYFNNKEVLTLYNSFTNKIPQNMDIKKLIMDAIKEVGIIKNDGDSKNYEGIAIAVEKALTPVVDDLDNKITDAVTKAIEDLVTKNDIINMATKEDIKDFATMESVTDKVKKVTDELEEVKKDIANKKGSEAGKSKSGNAEDKSVFNHDGVTWGTDNEK